MSFRPRRPDLPPPWPPFIPPFDPPGSEPPPLPSDSDPPEGSSTDDSTSSSESRPDWWPDDWPWPPEPEEPVRNTRSLSPNPHVAATAARPSVPRPARLFRARQLASRSSRRVLPRHAARSGYVSQLRMTLVPLATRVSPDCFHSCQY